LRHSDAKTGAKECCEGQSAAFVSSDIVEWYQLPRRPLIHGHEIGAQVVSTGKSITKYKPGDRVFIAPKVPCMTCHYCRNGHYPQCAEIKERLPGGFAEYILVPEILIKNGTYLLPDSMIMTKAPHRAAGLR
jgi:L-iditol 2-dehydrogenase